MCTCIITELGSDISSFTKSAPSWIKDLNGKPEIQNLADENIGNTLQKMLNRIPFAQELRPATDK